MYTSGNDDKKFGAAFLQDIITHVEENFEPQDVYGDDRLKEWATDNFDPGDLFTRDALRDWALSNGFVEG